MPRWIKRLLLFLFALLAVATGAVFAFGDQIAGVVARGAIAQAVRMAATRGITLEDVRFDGARLVGVGAIRCDAVAGTARVARDGVLPGVGRTLAFGADAVVVDVGWPWSGEARAAIVDGFVQAADEAGEGPTGVQISEIRAVVEFPFSWQHPLEAVRVLEAEARQLLADGRTDLPLDLTAVASFTVASRRHDLAVRTETTPEGGARVALDRADIERISLEYTNPLTATEIDLVARYPHRAATLLRVCEQASRAASAQRSRDRRFPYDAYRHVYWSWLLTRAFGPEFSEEVTDAHEVGATYEVGNSSRRMDLHNNAVGRAYALAGVREDELIPRVMADPNVMRMPPAATSAGPGGR